MPDDDPSVSWHQATPLAILVDEQNDYWETGRLNDVLVTSSGAFLVGADSGGVWSVTPQGSSALCLTDDWDNPDVRTLCFGPDGEDHVFAGGGTLHVTDPSATVPFFSWHEITSIAALNPGTIYDIAILRGPRRIVVACDAGLLWSEIPASSTSPGCLGALLGMKSGPWTDLYSWKPARAGDGTFAGQMFSVEFASANRDHQGPPEGLNETTVVAGARGVGSRGLFVGGWDSSGELVMNRAHLRGALDLLQLEMGSVALTVCTSHSARTYASCSDTNGRIMVVLRSDDGGTTWDACEIKLSGTIKGTLTKNSGTQGDDGWNNCIGVSPFDRDLVAVGWQNGPFISGDAGNTWQQADGYSHSDRHAIVWDPRFSVSILGLTAERLYVCSDGGLVSTDDRGHTFQAPYNRYVRTMQCYAAIGARESWGSVGGSGATPGVVSMGCQDNSNLYARLRPGPGPFVHLDGGDGGYNTFLSIGWVLHDIGLQATPQPIEASRWDSGSGTFVDTFVPPINGPKPGNAKDPKGLTGVTAMEAVELPKFARSSKLMQAVASQNGDIYGLFVGADPKSMEWRYLGSVTGTAWSVASIDGTSIFVGTDGRRIYNLDPVNGQAVEYLYDPSLTPGGSIFRIVPFSNSRAFAFRDDDSGGEVIALRGLVWENASSGIPASEGRIWGLDQARNIDNQTLVATTDANVWISYDDARTWHRASSGLPKRPHCSDIRFVKERDGSQRLYLGTYGRSLWEADLLPDVDGQVHIVGQPGTHAGTHAVSNPRDH